MGVLPCYRKSCDNIMCDYYINGVGYICWECKDEFEEFLKAEGYHTTTEGDIIKELKRFVETNKGDYFEGEEISVDEFFNRSRR